jgi:hypothetical protein
LDFDWTGVWVITGIVAYGAVDSGWLRPGQAAGYPFRRGRGAGTAVRPTRWERLRLTSRVEPRAAKKSVSRAVVERGRSAGSRRTVFFSGTRNVRTCSAGTALQMSESRTGGGGTAMVPTRPAGRPRRPGRDDARCGSHGEPSPYDLRPRLPRTVRSSAPGRRVTRRRSRAASSWSRGGRPSCKARGYSFPWLRRRRRTRPSRDAGRGGRDSRAGRQRRRGRRGSAGAC